MWRRAFLAALLCGYGILAAGAPPDAALVARGEAIYFGTDAALMRPGAVRVRGAPVPPQAAACVACHRRSGLGSAESDLIVPPIAGAFLFRARSPQTGQWLPWPSLDRTRPAYDERTLARALRDGLAPDGVPLSDTMPRYDLDAAAVAALAAYLRPLSVDTAPGVSDEEVAFAVVTTPEVPDDQVKDLLRALRTFLADRNAGTRHETRRRAQALRTERTMYRRFRRWRIEHWPLIGEPAGWDEQLRARNAATPVFALLGGLSYDTWAPVHAFCERMRMPCVLPDVFIPPAREDFYSVYLSAGLHAEADAAADALAGAPRVFVWTFDGPAGARQRERIVEALARRGLAVAQGTPGADDAVVAAAPSWWIERRYASLAAPPKRLLVLTGALERFPQDWRSADASLARRVELVTHFAPPAQARRQLARARAWFAARRIEFGAERVAVHALAAAMVANEMLVHVDDSFSREYCIEKTEHNLENVPPLTAFPRLAIGPGQRFAARRVFVRPLSEGTGPMPDRPHGG